jgi:hypothetical protein
MSTCAIADMFEPGMVFAFNIGRPDPKWRAGKPVASLRKPSKFTTTGARRMHTYPIEFQQTSHWT